MLTLTKWIVQSKGRFKGAEWHDYPGVYKTQDEAYLALLERQRYHRTKFAPKFRVTSVEVIEE